MIRELITIDSLNDIVGLSKALADFPCEVYLSQGIQKVSAKKIVSAVILDFGATFIEMDWGLDEYLTSDKDKEMLEKQFYDIIRPYRATSPLLCLVGPHGSGKTIILQKMSQIYGLRVSESYSDVRCYPTSCDICSMDVEELKCLKAKPENIKLIKIDAWANTCCSRMLNRGDLREEMVATYEIDKKAFADINDSVFDYHFANNYKHDLAYALRGLYDIWSHGIERIAKSDKEGDANG